jgi:hypothetical protein
MYTNPWVLPTLDKTLEKIVFDQIQYYFTINKLTTDFKHTYSEGHSTSTALTQMTYDWLREIDCRKIVGAVLLDLIFLRSISLSQSSVICVSAVLVECPSL